MLLLDNFLEDNIDLYHTMLLEIQHQFQLDSNNRRDKLLLQQINLVVNSNFLGYMICMNSLQICQYLDYKYQGGTELDHLYLQDSNAQLGIHRN